MHLERFTYQLSDMCIILFRTAMTIANNAQNTDSFLIIGDLYKVRRYKFPQVDIFSLIRKTI